MPHELSHVVVYQATKNPYGGLPTWLDEGLAMVAEGNQSASFTSTSRSAVAGNRLISVWALSSSFPTDARQAELSYAESESVVNFVVKTYGRDGVSRLLAQFREGATYDDALKAALGVDTYALDDAWRASLGLAPGALPPVPSATIARLAEMPIPPVTSSPAIRSALPVSSPSAQPTAVAIAASAP